MANHPDHYALVIGINDYAEKSRSLNGAINDAQAFIDWLTTDTGGGLDPEHCLSVLSTPSPLTPDQADIDDQIETLCNLVLTNQSDTGLAQRLYFYFSGHGTGISPSNVGLCYSRWGTGRKAALLSSSDYLTYLQNTGLFNEIIVILDCCRSWEGAGGAGPTVTFDKPDASRAPGVKTLTLFGSEFLARSIESLNPNLKQVRGYFTAALIDGLNGKAAMPATGDVTVEFLRNYLEREVPLRSKNAQKPRFRSGENIADSFVILTGTQKRIDYQYDTSSPVRFTIRYEPTITADVSVYTVFNEIRHKGTSPASFWLDKGRYFVVINYPTFIDSQEIDLQLDYTLQITGQPIPEVSPSKANVPPVSIKDQVPASSALIVNTAGTHETFGNPVEQASQKPTRSITTEASARLLIFVRHAHPIRDVLIPDAPMTRNLTLTDANGQLCSDFADDDLFIENENNRDQYKRDGYFALSVMAKPGLYFLLYSGDKPRQLAIRLYTGRQTVLFLLYDQQPLFSTARLFLADIRIGYRVYEQRQQQENLDLDTAIALFQTNQSFIAPDVVNRLLDAKFNNPMLGVVGAYLLLRGRMNREVWYAAFLDLIHQKRPWDETTYFSIVLANLEDLLGENDPDVKTLRLVAADFIDAFRDEVFVFDEPPLITWGLRQLIERSATNPKLIVPTSLILTIANRLYSDCVYSSWEYNQTVSILNETRESTRDIMLGTLVDDSVKMAVCDQLVYYIKRSEKNKVPIHPEQAPSASEIARRVSLPLLVIEAAIQELSRPDDWWWDDPTVVDQLGISPTQLQVLRELLESTPT